MIEEGRKMPKRESQREERLLQIFQQALEWKKKANLFKYSSPITDVGLLREDRDQESYRYKK